jgi:hypothetical protein
MSGCPVGCPLGNACRYAAVCAELLNPVWRRVPVGHLNETHVGRRLRVPMADRPLPLEGVLSGIWPFEEEMTVLRLDPPHAAPAVHFVHDSVEVEVW